MLASLLLCRSNPQDGDVKVSFRNNVEANQEKPLLGTAAMLVMQAINVGHRVCDLLGIAPPARGQRWQTLYERMESVDNQPRQDKEVDLIIRQGKVAMEEQLIEHADTALRQAVYVQFVHDNYLPPKKSLGAAAAYELRLKEMITALMTANRHLAMIEALTNSKGKHYSVRGAKGAQTIHEAPTNKMASQLIHAMVKGMIYNNPSLKKRNKTDAADEMATRIFKANREYEMLDIANLDALKYQVRNILIELTRDGVHASWRNTNRAQIAYSLRHSFPKRDTEEARQMDVDAARTLGQIEGVREALIQQLEQRFGELPSLVLETLDAVDDLDQLQIYLERLIEAQSLDTVMQDA
ncbi:hypothetical protein JJQ97_14440 [Pseudomonas syringae]|uniref:hypothetical protein n=1 Tax=Pseudomonas syringae TaxID=317 RepID=UPI00191755E3|nr:hypothetical protein [Pseudomonas syringae]QQQ48577.1 hypothetical protein JJQ97_14440 [Pseudomonas syringae]